MLAIGVGVGMFAMLTLLPTLLVTFPRGVFWPYRPTYGSAEPTTRGLWARVGWAIAPRPRIVWVTTAVILGILALGLTGLKANGLTNAQSFRGHPDSVTGETVLAAHVPAGAGQPVIVIGSPSAAGPLRAAFAAPPAPKAGRSRGRGAVAADPRHDHRARPHSWPFLPASRNHHHPGKCTLSWLVANGGAAG